VSRGRPANGSGDAAVRSATASLLWAACCPEPDLDGVARAQRDGADLDWAAHVALAQRVSPLLWWALQASGSVRAATGWSQRLRFDAMRWRLHALRLVPRALTASLAPLHAAGLEPVVMKGAALAERYLEPWLRPMDDIDLLLPADQQPEAIAVLRRENWRVVPKAGRHHEVVLTHPGVPGLPVEVHRSLATWRDSSNRLSSTKMWQRRRPQFIAGLPGYGLDPEDELVFLAAHAAKPFHVFSRLLWTVDIAVAVRAADVAGRAIDWRRVGEVAAESRCQTALAVALTQASRLGTPSPDTVCRCPATGARRAALSNVLSPDWPVLERDDRVRNTLRYALVDSRLQQLTLLTSAGMTKGPVRIPIDLVRRATGPWRRRASSGTPLTVTETVDRATED
jgi:hypothetical protein